VARFLPHVSFLFFYLSRFLPLVSPCFFFPSLNPSITRTSTSEFILQHRGYCRTRARFARPSSLASPSHRRECRPSRPPNGHRRDRRPATVARVLRPPRRTDTSISPNGHHRECRRPATVGTVLQPPSRASSGYRVIRPH
jgi:hypothetical protein